MDIGHIIPGSVAVSHALLCLSAQDLCEDQPFYVAIIIPVVHRRITDPQRRLQTRIASVRQLRLYIVLLSSVPAQIGLTTLGRK